MTYVAYKNKLPFRVGEWAVVRKKLKCETGHFEKGTKVKVVGISDYGYDLEDEYGNKIIHCGFHGIKKEKEGKEK